MSAPTSAIAQQDPSLSPTLPLAGKRVVVVGGKTGIGLGVAKAAHAAGATLIVASRRIESAEARPALAHFTQVVLDMRDESSVRAAFETIGTLDHLVVTASPDLGSWGSFMDADMQGVRSYMEGKFLGSWASARHAAPRLRAGGSITFLTGGLAVRPKPGFAAATSAFGAVEALSGSLALELAATRVNTIRPGFIDTEMWSFLPTEHRDGLRQRVAEAFPV
ncbi:SDR family oxidoreductase [Piscinibacter gummiphilus]|uniref:SDR family oxidoreductase n=1 Tax=Piscinibacter gummiphilus TaxID=946333 RepID=A0ABZ0CXC7_9BURK|nr:SDR family oxidoreductase [Piscinibacter gummiphilus]WOB07124.1 SDR family oxidoreductase [Piscinibacter gummiphilus]